MKSWQYEALNDFVSELADATPVDLRDMYDGAVDAVEDSALEATQRDVWRRVVALIEELRDED
jgi:hypothetical protein